MIPLVCLSTIIKTEKNTFKPSRLTIAINSIRFKLRLIKNQI